MEIGYMLSYKKQVLRNSMKILISVDFYKVIKNWDYFKAKEYSFSGFMKYPYI